MSKLQIGKPFAVALNGQEYRIEWLGPDHLFEDPAPAILGGPLRPSKEGDYGQHIETVYNMQEDIPRGDLDPEDFRSDSGDVRWGDYWGEIGRRLKGKVEWFSLLAFDGDMPAGKLRFFPKTLTRPRWVGWDEEQHQREWTDDILWIGAAFVDPMGVEDGLDSELVRRVIEYARVEGFAKIQAVGCSEVRTYAQWSETFPASIYRAHGFRTIAWGGGSPDAFEHMVNGCHGPRSRELARAAIDSGIHPDTAPLCQVVELSLGELEPATQPQPAVAPPSDGFMTPLHEAAFQAHVPTAEYLLSRGADVNARDPQGRTPLALAKTEEMEELLRKHGGEA